MERHRIAVLVRDGVLAMELGVVHRVFGEACDAEGRAFYEVTTCALEAGRVRTDGDFCLGVEHGPELLGEVSTVVVTSTDRDAVSVSDAEQSAMTAALRRVRPGTRVASICTAAFLLAAAGLLDGRDATTHWARVAAFRERFPAVRVRPEVFYTVDGDVLTSAGVASVADMCLHMARSDHGATVSGVVARRVVMPPHRQAGEAQLIERPMVEDRIAGTARARSWALEHLDDPLSLRDLGRVSQGEGLSWARLRW